MFFQRKYQRKYRFNLAPWELVQKIDIKDEIFFKKLQKFWKISLDTLNTVEPVKTVKSMICIETVQFNNISDWP